MDGKPRKESGRRPKSQPTRPSESLPPATCLLMRGQNRKRQMKEHEGTKGRLERDQGGVDDAEQNRRGLFRIVGNDHHCTSDQRCAEIKRSRIGVLRIDDGHQSDSQGGARKPSEPAPTGGRGDQHQNKKAKNGIGSIEVLNWQNGDDESVEEGLATESLRTERAQRTRS